MIGSRKFHIITPFTGNPISASLRDWREVRKSPVLMHTMLGIGYFGFLGSMFLTIIPVYGKSVLALSEIGSGLLVMILSWNEYLLALFLSTSKAQTMPILVAAMNAGERGILWWSMSVVIVVMIIPVITMALLLQKFISKGVLLGAVKG